MNPDDCSLSNDDVYITKRNRKMILRAKSVESIHTSFDSSDTDILARSLDLSTGQELHLTERLRAENLELKHKLEISHNEIDNLHLEINQLKNTITAQVQQLDSLKIICQSPIQNRKAQMHLKRKTSRQSLMDNSRCLEKKEVKIQKMPLIQKHHTTKTSTETDIQSQQIRIVKKNNYDLKDKRTIHIFGGKQCRGLAREVIKLRLDTKYENYSVTSFIKPGGKSTEILSSISSGSFKENDRIIISVGEHDSNPVHITAELTATLKILQNYHIFVLGICKNIYLKEKMLNNLLKVTCSQFKNCTFLGLDNIQYNNYKFFNKTDLCKYINTSIDQYDYNLKYLKHKFKSTTCRAPHKTDLNSKMSIAPKKGTIPFYFPRINGPSQSVCNSNSILKSYKKGTIPFYFSNMNTRACSNNINKEFFP